MRPINKNEIERLQQFGETLMKGATEVSFDMMYRDDSLTPTLYTWSEGPFDAEFKVMGYGQVEKTSVSDPTYVFVQQAMIKLPLKYYKEGSFVIMAAPAAIAGAVNGRPFDPDITLPDGTGIANLALHTTGINGYNQMISSKGLVDGFEYILGSTTVIGGAVQRIERQGIPVGANWGGIILT